MQQHFPMPFTLENGTKVIVNKMSEDTYEFLLTEVDGKTDNFTYTKDNRLKEDVESSLGYHQVDALRTFWLNMRENNM